MRLLSEPAGVRAGLLARVARIDFTRYFSIGEQITLSAINMLASLAVLAAAGVALFGIYSFAFTIATFVNGVLQVSLHRQMTLEISAAEESRQCDVFLVTLLCQIAVLLVMTFGFEAILFVLPVEHALAQHADIARSLIVFVFALNLFDLARQYLYATDGQAQSFRYTLVYAAVSLCGLGLIVLWAPPERAVASTYLVLATALSVSLLSNTMCRRALGFAVWRGWQHAHDVISGYLGHARFSLAGMLVTWAQNQSMTPFLMLVGGPLVVGWFNLARLFVMPMTVIAQGLANATIPSLRRIVQSDGKRALANDLRRIVIWNSLVGLAYALVLWLAHASGLLERFVPDYADVAPYLLFWMALLSMSILRSWIGQFFIVQMRFPLMLIVNIAAVTVTLGGMALAAWVFVDIRFALASVILGEITSVAILTVLARRELHDSDLPIRPMVAS